MLPFGPAGVLAFLYKLLLENFTYASIHDDMKWIKQICSLLVRYEYLISESSLYSVPSPDLWKHCMHSSFCYNLHLWCSQMISTSLLFIFYPQRSVCYSLMLSNVLVMYSYNSVLYCIIYFCLLSKHVISLHSAPSTGTSCCSLQMISETLLLGVYAIYVHHYSAQCILSYRVIGESIQISDSGYV